MYRKLWYASVVLIVISLTLGIVGLQTMAAPGDYSYQIKVVKDGQPLSGAYVRIAGVGVEITDTTGIATFDISDAPGRGQGRQELFRGPLYAALKGKQSGPVTDEYNILRIIVSSHDLEESPAANEPSFTLGTDIFIKLNTVYTIQVN